ncbi:hypothetical protein BV25DRAFT_1901464 [Artomyces pyxidatus]|uniref:Uncharacterized protein n=1 Tax=Artomyces pyxidatus TaxID=48021 RepID=A0ACB8STI3_9AGAM|nr:hypothetical protein BV25DRAFT_1901464 [Artomyces pyxidatus]
MTNSAVAVTLMCRVVDNMGVVNIVCKGGNLVNAKVNSTMAKDVTTGREEHAAKSRSNLHAYTESRLMVTYVLSTARYLSGGLPMPLDSREPNRTVAACPGVPLPAVKDGNCVESRHSHHAFSEGFDGNYPGDADDGYTASVWCSLWLKAAHAHNQVNATCNIGGMKDKVQAGFGESSLCETKAGTQDPPSQRRYKIRFIQAEHEDS